MFCVAEVETNGREWGHPAVIHAIMGHTRLNHGRSSARLSAESHVLSLAAKLPDET